MKEQISTEIILHDIDATAIELLLDYAYTGQVTITADNVQVLLPASGLLQMQEVKEACCRFLMKQLHPTNCLGIRSFAGETKNSESFFNFRNGKFHFIRHAFLQGIVGEIPLFCPAEFPTGRHYGRIFIVTI